MRRALLILAGIAVVTWFEFEFFPGHGYLRSETQVYVPILERLASPGLLSRDLVATHPLFTYTIYDEVTLFLHEVLRLKIETALLAQQIVFRAAGTMGIFLLALSGGMSDLRALLTSAIINLGGFLPGPELHLIDPEPTTRAFAFGLLLLCIGFFAREKPLLAGFAGGLAFVYDARAAAPFWIALLIMFACDPKLRRLARPSLTILAVFILLLANMAQLQPGARDPRGLFDKVAAPITRIQQYRTPSVWVSSWVARDLWIYLALLLVALWVTRQVWPSLNRQARWLLILLPILGLLSVPLSYVLLERARWFLVPQIQPAQTLSLLVVCTSVVCAIAGMRATSVGRWRTALPYLGLILLIPATNLYRRAPAPALDDVQLANWAEANTWGGSMFLFPDAGKDLYPGAFRARSRRAVWVDWETGTQADYFDTFADEWSRRWQDTMEGDYSEKRLQRLLFLPIDYFVLKRAHKLAGIKPVFGTDALLVYDAQAIRTSPLGVAATKKRED